MKECGLGEAELYQGHIEPKDKEALKAWRLNPPLDEIRGVRKKFDDAGIELYALNYSFNERFTDPEIERKFFEMIMARSGEERFMMGVRSFDAAREIVLASLPKNLPHDELNRRLFERIYGASIEEIVKQTRDGEELR